MKENEEQRYLRFKKRFTVFMGILAAVYVIVTIVACYLTIRSHFNI